jgi:flagellar FliJ protein
MAKFTFRFEPLLRHRRLIEDQRQRDLARLMRSQMIFHGQLRNMQQTIRQSKQDLAAGLVGKVDLMSIGRFAGYSSQVSSRGREIVSKLAELESHITSARQRLLDASRQRKAMELLRDKHATQWQHEQDRREVNELDEISSQQYIRRHLMEASR